MSPYRWLRLAGPDSRAHRMRLEEGWLIVSPCGLAPTEDASRLVEDTRALRCLRCQAMERRATNTATLPAFNSRKTHETMRQLEET